MIKKIYNILRSFKYDLPEKNRLLLFDEMHSATLRQIIKRDFNILELRKKKIYFWIYFKQLIFFDFSFKTYCKNYIKFTSPKVIITFNEARFEMYELKNLFKDVSFISLMNGTRNNYWFKSNKKIIPKNLKCDYLIVLNKYFIPKYNKLIKSDYRAFGHFRNNSVKIKKTKFKKQFLLISQVHESPVTGLDHQTANFHIKLLKFMNMYLLNSNKKLHILLRRNIKSPRYSLEVDFYKKIFKSNCIFHQSTEWRKKYELLDKFENIVFTFSVMGYEAIARKKKVAVFSPNKINNFISPDNFVASKYHFGWPGPYKKKYNFFSTRKLTYKEVARVLKNVNGCNQNDWNRKYYPAIKDQFYFDKNNEKLRSLILKLINN